MTHAEIIQGHVLDVVGFFEAQPRRGLARPGAARRGPASPGKPQDNLHKRLG